MRSLKYDTHKNSHKLFGLTKKEKEKNVLKAEEKPTVSSKLKAFCSALTKPPACIRHPTSRAFDQYADLNIILPSHGFVGRFLLRSGTFIITTLQDIN